MRPKIALFAIALVLSLAGVGCKVYEPSLATFNGPDRVVTAGAKSVAAVSGNAGSASAAPQTTVMPASVVSTCSSGECWWTREATGGTCRSAGAPGTQDRPRAGPNDATELADIYLGWTKLTLGQTDPSGAASADAWQHFGLDLDGRCTGSSTCVESADAQSCSAHTQVIPHDGELCRDNTFASLQPVAAAVPELGKTFGLNESVYRCDLWRGTYNIVLKISGYNGEPDDSQVRVDLYASPGLVDTPSWECPVDNLTETYPRWRTSEPWQIDRTALMGEITKPGSLPPSKFADANAYVRGGYLVALLPDGTPVQFMRGSKPYRSFELKMQRPIWVGNLIQQSDSTWRIRDGLVAGRIRTGDFVGSFRQAGLCEGVGLDDFYRSVVGYIDDNADLLASGEIDPSMPCDAVSVALSYEAAELTPGPAGDGQKLIECCAAGAAYEDCSPVCGDGRRNGTEKCDSAIPDGKPGACPKRCTSSDRCVAQTLVGTGCATECVGKTITTIGAADGCCPVGANTSVDSDCAAVCGNGLVEPGETCDPADQCPVCDVSDKCLIVNSSGSKQQCNAACAYVKQTACKDNDGCCPAGCSHSNDQDCSTSCGDGKIDPGETCEKGVKDCPTDCDDDEPCTTDVQSGAADSCNVICTHIAITAPFAGDSCCPMGASANTDDDCKAMCGNRKLEQGEECDDGNRALGDGCNADCKQETPAETCLAILTTTASDACAECTCAKCSAQAASCYLATPASDVALCSDLVSCHLETGCRSDACYCGDNGLTGCVSGQANGQCRAQVEAAARSTSPGDIVTRLSDTTYPLARGAQLAECAQTTCASECASK